MYSNQKMDIPLMPVSSASCSLPSILAKENIAKNPPMEKRRTVFHEFVGNYLQQLGKIELNQDERENIADYKDLVEKAGAGVSPRLNLVSQNWARNKFVPAPIRDLSFRIISDYQTQKLPSDEDVKSFADFLYLVECGSRDENGQKTISFNELMTLRKSLPRSVFNFLTPATFFQFHSKELIPPPQLRVPIATIMEYISLKAAFTRNLISMCKYDTDGTGTLNREQFQNFYREEVMQAVEVLQNFEQNIEICYLSTVESMFFFFLDPKHTCRIRITDAVVSGFLENAYGLQANFVDCQNWFSPEKTHELIACFQMYDCGQKNFLTRDDFKRGVQNGTFSSTFVERLFETHVAQKGERMSYEEFLVFEIAHNHLAHPASLAYFFKILDVDDDGCLTNYELRYFYAQLRLDYNGWFIDGVMPEFDDFADQLFDMIKPGVDGRITLRELTESKQGHDFILCLISYTEFYRYETRENDNTGMLDQDSELPEAFFEDDGLVEGEAEMPPDLEDVTPMGAPDLEEESTMVAPDVEDENPVEEK